MKQRIISVLCSMFGYRIIDEWENERYYYVRLDEDVITYVVLRELIEQELRFLIDATDCDKDSVVITFLKR